jgi:hypothetical protein
MTRLPRPIVGALCVGASILFVLSAKTDVYADAVLTFTPTSIVFDSIAVGGSTSASILIKNTGSSTTSISNVFAVSGDTQLAASPASFDLASDQSQVVMFTFSPVRAGNLTDAFKLESDAVVFGSTAPVINVPVTGTAKGPLITFSRTGLSFESLSVGTSVSDTLVIGNAGTEALGVLSFLTTSNDFTIGSSILALAPGDTQSVVVTYTPTATTSVRDTLTVLSDSPDANLSYIALDALETPTDPKSARISILRTYGSVTPAVGDSIRLALFLIPAADTVRGVEAFLGYDDAVFQPTTLEPFQRSNLTVSPGFQINVVETAASSDAVAHMSTFFSQNQRGSDTLAVVVLEVLKEIRDETTIRILTEKPLRNSNFLSPENVSFAIPGSTKVTLGNRTPEIAPFGILLMDEDANLVVDLSSQASDKESTPLNLVWQFSDANALFQLDVATAEGVQTLSITPPQDGFGVFDVLAVVTDEGGVSDSAAVILDVRPTNDPPNAPQYDTPTDGSEGLESPVSLMWTGSDPDGDAVTYDVLVGTTPTNLQPTVTNLGVPQHDAQGLAASATYFWQVVTIDPDGARTEGEVLQFKTAPDVTPPQFVTPPRDTLATSTTILIQWDTDETSTSVVRLGLLPDLADSTDFGVEGSDVFRVLRHQVTISNLAPSTTYYFNASSSDLFGNLGVSDIASFVTLEPEFILGDFDGNRTIDFNDFLSFAVTFNQSLGQSSYNALGDFDGNNLVDFTDFLAFALVFGTTP